jgi:hypothetical protein
MQGKPKKIQANWLVFPWISLATSGLFKGLRAKKLKIPSLHQNPLWLQKAAKGPF